MSEKNINHNSVEQKSSLSPIVGVRISRKDMDIIRQAAQAQALPYSAFIRHAAVSLARQINSKTAESPTS